MADDIVFRKGEKKALFHTVHAVEDERFTISAVKVNVYDENGEAVITDAAGVVDTTESANEHGISYILDTSPLDVGDYTYTMTYTKGRSLEEIVIPGEFTILPPTSKFDRYVQRVIDWLAETHISEAQRELSYKQYRNAILAAVREYEKTHPQKKTLTIDAVSGVYDYDLPPEWQEGVSQISRIEYPVGAGPGHTYHVGDEYEVDEAEGVIRFFMNLTTGQQFKLWFTAPQVLSNTTDTLPDKHFEPITQYAAGVALMMLANKAAQTAQYQIGAQGVTYDGKSQLYAKQSEEMKAEALKAWGKTPRTGTAHWRYMDDARRFVY